MKTDDLISMLGTNVEPVDHREVARTVHVAIGIGVAATLGFTLLMLGIRADLNEVGAWTFLILKLAFATGIIVLSSIYLIRVARPGNYYLEGISDTAALTISPHYLAGPAPDIAQQR
jgi:hypothetical protein